MAQFSSKHAITTEVRGGLRDVISRLFGEQVIGAIDYQRFPDRILTFGGPFNGQLSRQQLFLSLVDCFRPAAIVETGTYLGTTTEFMANTGLPILTVEAHPRNFGFARARLRRRRNVKLFLGDSRAFLQKVLDGLLHNLSDCTLFFYLDAHWNDDLPLAREIEIVFSRCPAAIVMIDDFQVPFDPGYAYDDYGPRKALTASYIAPMVSSYQLLTFYPAIPSVAESGMQRGCIVLAKEDVHGKALTSIPLLRLVEETERALSA